MKQTSPKIFNDPIYGFITIPKNLLFDLIEHRYFQRLRRISQMGLSYLVYPGAHHTRFQHALGSMYLMQKAIGVLRYKDVAISKDEENALYIAILLHDIGHGPFSHAMEHSIVEGLTHEQISLHFMEALNKEFNGILTLAIEIFKGLHSRKFLGQLVSGQLDMDRLDYLKRDSFYTGVPEGNINSERLISMLNVVDDSLVVEEKGIYSVEKFIVARRLMYWQVYLHKTGIVAEKLLVKIMKRAKELTMQGVALPASTAFSFFLSHTIRSENFTKETLDMFSTLDDYDIIFSLKQWTKQDDFVLRTLCQDLLDRKLLRIEIENNPIALDRVEVHLNKMMATYNLTAHEASYFVFSGSISNRAYRSDKNAINLLTKSGVVVDVAKASDQLNISALSVEVIKYYLCYPKALD